MILSTPLEQIHLLEKSLLKHKNSVEAPLMEAYMKGRFQFLGIKSPIRKAVQKKWICQLPKNIDRWDLVCLLWDKNEREYHYIAIDYLNRMPKSGYRIDDDKLLEDLLTTKSWWDSVDAIASNYVGVYFQTFPEKKNEVITRWRNSANMWLNRTCLIFQLKYKDDVDFELLKDLIRQYQPNKEFFIQKAIGWALRQYSKFNPTAVAEFIDEIKLTGLARREAAKYI